MICVIFNESKQCIFTKLKYTWMYYDIWRTFLITIFLIKISSKLIESEHRKIIVYHTSYFQFIDIAYYFAYVIIQALQRNTDLQIIFLSRQSNNGQWDVQLHSLRMMQIINIHFFLYWKMEGFICAMTLHTLMFIKLIFLS